MNFNVGRLYFTSSYTKQNAGRLFVGVDFVQCSIVPGIM